MSSPIFHLFRHPPSYSKLRVFWLYILSIFGNLSYKLLSRTFKCVFLGYCVELEGYQCLDRKTNRVIFHEMYSLRASTHMIGRVIFHEMYTLRASTHMIGRVTFHEMYTLRSSTHMTGNDARLQNKFSYCGTNIVQLGNGEHLLNSYIGNISLSLGSSAFQHNNVCVAPTL